jgi:hypothetical protein
LSSNPRGDVVDHDLRDVAAAGRQELVIERGKLAVRGAKESYAGQRD